MAPRPQGGVPAAARRRSSRCSARSGFRLPALARDEYTLGQLLDEVVAPQPALRAVEVHKRRARYTIGGCMTELTDVRADGASTRTIAIESDDAGRVLATVQELGLAGRPNVSFPRGLRKLLGFGAGRYAVVDVGTNSVKFHVGERDAAGAWSTVADRAEVTRLGEGLAETGPAAAGADRPHGRRDRGHGRRGGDATASSRRPRSEPPRCGSRRTRPS